MIRVFLTVSNICRTPSDTTSATRIPENNETPPPPILQDFLGRWAANGKAKEIFELPHGVSRKRRGKHETKVEKYWKRVGLEKVHPDSITEEMLDEDDNTPMSEEEEDHGEDADHHLSTDTLTIHVHGGEEATIE
ncbi:hypothetical protein FMUND_11790 [Fusarium mundagurra]|uniref:Uncharacterized protein n=1 Tax=Fusarium mundagurra TaxID=1567541 RepID=A0A8H5Y565_9HYPO|nr:hypothetical protein FMUND_11790 [Fusarium mundagurra]